MADIEPLRTKDGPGWGAKAAAGDALNRVPNESPFLAVWKEKNAKGEEVIRWSKANCNFEVYSTMAMAFAEFAQACIRDAMDRAGK